MWTNHHHPDIACDGVFGRNDRSTVEPSLVDAVSEPANLGIPLFAVAGCERVRGLKAIAVRRSGRSDSDRVDGRQRVEREYERDPVAVVPKLVFDSDLSVIGCAPANHGKSVIPPEVIF